MLMLMFQYFFLNCAQCPVSGVQCSSIKYETISSNWPRHELKINLLNWCYRFCCCSVVCPVTSVHPNRTKVARNFHNFRFSCKLTFFILDSVNSDTRIPMHIHRTQCTKHTAHCTNELVGIFEPLNHQ